MKRIIALLLAALLCLPLFSALAQPRYPENQGAVTDAAAVLSSSTVQDLRKLTDRLKDGNTLNLYVVTVDFLDGTPLTGYAEGLRNEWRLGQNDLLLLMAVGEDKFGFFGGTDVNRRLSSSVQQKLLSTYFDGPFMRQDYDGAVSALVSPLVTEINKAWDKKIDGSGLFGTVSRNSLNTEQDWLLRSSEYIETFGSRMEQLAERSVDMGFSLGKVILTVILLTILFGNLGKRRNRTGCGCMPFSSMMAGWGLWKLWKRK